MQYFFFEKKILHKDMFDKVSSNEIIEINQILHETWEI